MESKREFSFYWFTPPGLPHGCTGPFSVAFSGTLIEEEVEQLELVLVSTWDAGTAGGGLTCCVTTPVPIMIFKAKPNRV